jgi:polysaccharide chain length determinant protein (PEP-CTERM system associated)
MSSKSSLIINLAALLWAGWRRRYLVIVPVLLLPLSGAIVGILAPKNYQTSTTILFQEAAQQNPFLEDLSIATNLKARMAALNALLHSRHILASVAWKMELLQKSMNQKEKAVVIGQLSKSLNVRLVGENLIKITYNAPERENMVEMLSLVSMRFVERVLAPQRSSIIQSESFLATELEQRRKSLEKAETSLAEYKNKFASELPALHSANVARLSQLKTYAATRRIELQGSKAAQKSLAIRLSQTNPVIGKIEESIVNILAELSQLRARYTDNHSRVQNVVAHLNSLEKERRRILSTSQQLDPNNLDPMQLERLWAIATTARTGTGTNNQPQSSHLLLISQLERLQQADDQIQRLSKEVTSLELEINKLEQQVNGFGQHERRLNQLKRDIQVRLKIFQDLSERHELARVTGSLGKNEESERVKLIDPPFEPLAPSNLPLVMFVLAGLFSGIGLGIGLAVIAELLDTSIRRQDTLSQMLNTQTLARIPPQGIQVKR